MEKEKILNNKVLLIVEDDSVLAKDLAIFFKDSGFSVLQAGDGEAGLEMAVKERPNVILLDILLPKMDGLTMLKKLREEHNALKIPVVLLTNLEVNNDVLKALVKNQPSYYLIKKDWRMEDILQVVNDSLATPSS